MKQNKWFRKQHYSPVSQGKRFCHNTSKIPIKSQSPINEFRDKRAKHRERAKRESIERMKNISVRKVAPDMNYVGVIGKFSNIVTEQLRRIVADPQNNLRVPAEIRRKRFRRHWKEARSL